MFDNVVWVMRSKCSLSTLNVYRVDLILIFKGYWFWFQSEYFLQMPSIHIIVNTLEYSSYWIVAIDSDRADSDIGPPERVIIFGGNGSGRTTVHKSRQTPNKLSLH